MAASLVSSSFSCSRPRAWLGPLYMLPPAILIGLFEAYAVQVRATPQSSALQ